MTKQLTASQRLLLELKNLAADQERTIKSLEASPTTAGLQQLQKFGVVWSRNKKFSKFALGQILFYFKSKWETLPKSFIQSYSAGYYEYVLEVFGLKAQMADMYLEVWETYLSGKYSQAKTLPAFVDLIKLSVPKLAAAAPYIRRGEMTKDRWKVLSTTGIAGKELRRGLRDNKLNSKVPIAKSQKNTEVLFIQETGDLIQTINGKREQVGFLNINSANSDVLLSIKGILSSAKIRTIK